MVLNSVKELNEVIENHLELNKDILKVENLTRDDNNRIIYLDFEWNNNYKDKPKSVKLLIDYKADTKNDEIRMYIYEFDTLNYRCIHTEINYTFYEKSDDKNRARIYRHVYKSVVHMLSGWQICRYYLDYVKRNDDTIAITKTIKSSGDKESRIEIIKSAHRHDISISEKHNGIETNGYIIKYANGIKNITIESNNSPIEKHILTLCDSSIIKSLYERIYTGKSMYEYSNGNMLEYNSTFTIRYDEDNAVFKFKNIEIGGNNYDNI